MATVVVTPAVTVNYAAAVVPPPAPPAVVSTSPVAVNYALRAFAVPAVTTPAVTVNYSLASVDAGLYRYIGGRVVRPGLYHYTGGRVIDMSAAPAPAAYPPNYGAIGTYWPSAATTGVPAGITLTVVNGDLTTTANNQVIDSTDVHGNLIVQHTGVTFQRGIVRGQATVPSTQAANIVLVDCTNPAVRTFLIRDSEIYCQAPNQWSVGIDGHDYTMERCNQHDLQDAARIRPRSSTDGQSYVTFRQNWVHDFTWYQVDTTRAASGQTHNDARQDAGGSGFLSEGENLECYYGPNGQEQPTLRTNTSTAWANDVPPVKSTTTAPELAAFMLNVAGSGQQVTGITIRRTRVAGAVTPINMGDPGLAGANIGQITENIFTSDSPANDSTPAKYLRQQPTQTVDWGQGDPLRCNTYADGPSVGQELPVRYDAASSSTPPTAAFTGTPLSGAGSVTTQFTSTSTGNPTSYAWTFGDGGTSTAKSPSHTYTTAGTYTVALTVSNAGGTNTQTRTGYVTVASADIYSDTY
jgi:hypothetical protein